MSKSSEPAGEQLAPSSSARTRIITTLLEPAVRDNDTDSDDGQRKLAAMAQSLQSSGDANASLPRTTNLDELIVISEQGADPDRLAPDHDQQVSREIVTTTKTTSDKKMEREDIVTVKYLPMKMSPVSANQQQGSSSPADDAAAHTFAATRVSSGASFGALRDLRVKAA